jgi:lysophospholipase L1-like esterase
MTSGAETRRGRPGFSGRVAWAVLAALLVLSLGANAVLGSSALAYFASMLDVRLDPVGLKVYEAERAKDPPPGPVLLFFGDSRALMWTEPDSLAGFHVVNRGIGFQSTAQIAMRIDSDVVPLHPSVVVLEAGVNDLKAIAQLPARRAEIVADCESNLERIVNACRRAGATVVVVSIFDIGDVSLWKRPFWSDSVSAAVREVNAFLPRLAGPKVLFFDAAPVLGGPGGRVEHDYQLDYLHLSPAGYRALDGRLVPLLSGLPR